MDSGELQQMATNSVFVDADACPVKAEIMEVCRLFPVKLYFVAAYTNITDKYPEVNWIWITPGRDAVDLYIMNHIKKNDIVVTDDLGLSAGCLGKNAYIINSRGKEISNTNIDFLLADRHISAKNRRAGKHQKGPKKILATDKLHFSTNFLNLLSKIAGEK